MNKYLLFTLNIAILTACSQKPHPIAELFKDYQGEKVVYHTGSSTSFRNIFY
ncbi:hypothetical protein [Aquiflexum lacus]|uniref:hypothetical protein n=1 Tax=Aquiflexum lacus TaxID=2483805 RepID=UPI0018953280|nr:hypothetical protein [Aquiflexum lacus]